MVEGVQKAELTKEEIEIFEKEWPRLTSLWLKELNVGRPVLGKTSYHLVNEWFEPYKDQFLELCAMAKAQITPSAGKFEGVHARTGFGWRITKIEDITPLAAGTTWRVNVTTSGWRGHLHNGAIGAACTSTDYLYLRKDVAVGIVGLADFSGACTATDYKYVVNEIPSEVIDLEYSFLGDLPLYDFGKVIYLRPAVRYNSKAYFSNTGYQELRPLGISFIKAEKLTDDSVKSTESARPMNTAP